MIEAPTCLTIFDHDAAPGPVDWTLDYYKRVYFARHASGGHFAPAEEPGAVVQDLRETFRKLR